MFIIFYDGWCANCTEIMFRLKRADVAHKLRFLSFRDFNKSNKIHYPRELLHKMEHTLFIYDKKEKQFISGIHAVKKICQCIPSLWLYVPLISLSIHLSFHHKLCEWFIQRRKIVPIGACDHSSCQIHHQNIEKRRQKQ